MSTPLPSGSRSRRALRAVVGLAIPATAAAVAAADLYLEGRWGLPHGVWLLVIAFALAWAWIFLPAPSSTKALLAISTALTLLAAEGGLRLFLATEYAALYRIDPDYLHGYIPGARKVFRHAPVDGGAKILTTINREGFRDQAPAASPPDRRVILYGDSYIAAEQSPLHATVAQRLESILSERTRERVEVINAGVTAYGPDQICIRMREEVPRLAPDLVVVSIYSDNDFGDLVRNKLFRLDGTGRAVLTGARVRPALRDEFTRAGASLLYNAAQRFVRITIRSVRGRPGGARRGAARTPDDVALASWLERGEAEYRARATADRPEVSRIFEDYYDADVGLTPESESAIYKRRLLEGVLSLIQAQLAERGVPLVLLIVPSPVDLTDFVEGTVVDRARYPLYAPSHLTDEIAAIAARLGIDHLNLYAPFEAADPRTLYYRAAAHWNDRGEALAADTLAARILAGGYLGPR